jgi:protein O-mannosyl-transferase
MNRHPANALMSLSLVAAVFAVYWPGIHGGYVFDDFPNIVDNARLHVTSLDGAHWVAAALSSEAGLLQRPLALLSFAANHYFTGLAPAPMKLTNIAIHALNALLVLGLVRQLLAMAPSGAASAVRRAWAARFAATAWALHPINLMAVLFVVQRMESLSHTFVFGGLWLYLLGRQRQLSGGNGWPLVIGGLLGGTLLGMLAKESAALLPLYAFLAELCLLRFATAGTGNRRNTRLLLFFVAVLALPAVAGVAWLLPKMLQPEVWAGRDFSMAERLLTQARVVVDYLRWIVLPDLGQLSLYHDDYRVSSGLLSPPGTLAAILGLVGLLALAAWCRLRRPLVSLGILWFLGAHLLTATFIPFELVYEHRNYFASLGICLAAADLLLLAPRNDSARRIGVLLAVIAVIGASTITHLRAREWSDPYRFAASEAAKHPQSPRATYGLAATLATVSRLDPDSPLFEPALQALEHARGVPGSNILPLSGLIMLAAHAGTPQDPQVWEEMQQRLHAAPIGPQEQGALSTLVRCAREGRCTFPEDLMRKTFETALARDRSPDLLSMWSDYTLNVLDDPAGALDLARESVHRSPGTAQYRINLIRLLIALGREQEAREQIRQLRANGRLGQNETSARLLEARMRRQPQNPRDNTGG